MPGRYLRGIASGGAGYIGSWVGCRCAVFEDSPELGQIIATEEDVVVRELRVGALHAEQQHETRTGWLQFAHAPHQAAILVARGYECGIRVDGVCIDYDVVCAQLFATRQPNTCCFCAATVRSFLNNNLCDLRVGPELDTQFL